MVKVGRLVSAHHRLCLAHGLQLGIIDVLYKKKENSDDIVWNNTDDENDSESEYSAEFDFLHECFDEDYLKITEHRNLSLIINKVRTISRTFRKSPQKNEVLQNYSKMDIGKELNLILDCKTRWSSLHKMLDRFLVLEDPIKKVAIDLKTPCLEENEFKLIKTVVDILKPVELAVRSLCRQDMNLCTADAAILFMLKELDNMVSPLALELFDSIKKRILQGRTVYTSMLNFLKKGRIENTLIEPHINIQTIVSKVLLLQRFKKENNEPEND